MQAPSSTKLVGEIASEIAGKLFKNGQGQVAERLVLTVDGPPTRDLGGWGRRAVQNAVAKALTDRLVPSFDVDGASARDRAVYELLFLVAIEGVKPLSRGGKGCIFRAVEALRPDIAARWAGDEDPHDLLKEYFPEVAP